MLRFVDGKVAKVEFLTDLNFNPTQFTNALDRARLEGVKILHTPSGETFATSTSESDKIYPVSIDGGCECLGYTNGKLCKHYARVLFEAGLNVLPYGATRTSW